ncbi:MAG: alpha/beta fold hydrolase [Acidobacteriota bacterium]|nr:alpha/beta fold hydrolase [Acidobacteriota bacterium]
MALRLESHPMRSFASAMALLVLAAVVSGCVSLRPYEEVWKDPRVVRFVDVDGQRVHVEVRGSGEPVVLVHGFGGSVYSWRLVVPELSQTFQTIAIDLNGFGYTERPEARKAYSRTGQLDLLSGAMDALGVESAHFVGHSYGGGLVLTLAHQRPERVRSVVAVNSVAPEWSARGRRLKSIASPVAPLFIRGWALRSRNIDRALRRSFSDDELVTPELVESYRERLRVEGAIRAFRNLGKPRGGSADLAAVPYEEIQQPILLVWGREDTLIPVEKARSAAARMPHGHLTVLEDCGHMPMEEQPGAFVAEVERFLSEGTRNETMAFKPSGSRIISKWPPPMMAASTRAFSS